MLPRVRRFHRGPGHLNRRRRADALIPVERVSVPASKSLHGLAGTETRSTGSRALTLTGEALTQAAPVVQRSVYARKARVSEVTLVYAMLAPALILLIAFELFPILYGLFISTCDWRLSCVEFIGADNYVRAFRDPAM